ncbi:MAG: glycosyltransferase family 2 protein [Bacteroidota bacterium]
MTARLPLSVIITTYNESDNIRDAIKSVEWAQEVIVVDAYSTDGTKKIAKSLGATVWERAYRGPADQKNWAIPRAHFSWVLILDADERASPELHREIRQLLALPPVQDAYWIKRHNHFMGKRVRYSGWQGDKVIRLIQRDKCRYNNKQVHEEIDDSNLRIGKLKSPLLHFTFKDVAHYLAKTERYAYWSAQDHLPQTKRVTFFHLYLKPLFRFFKHYIWQGGILDGQVGFIISRLMAWGVFLRYWKIKEMQEQNANAENSR